MGNLSLSSRLTCLLLAMLPCATQCGCKRPFFHRCADRQSYGIVAEKGAGPNWQIPGGFTIDPDERARFRDPTCRVDPMLPVPAPQLHLYQLPDLATATPPPRALPSSEVSGSGPVAGPESNDLSDAEEIEASEVLLEEFGEDAVLQIPPVPQDAWQSLPASCLQRMLEFETIRSQYSRSFQVDVTEQLLDPAPRVNLENILEIALINNREYQTRKEQLYASALRLSLRRFDFDLRFTRLGNGIRPSYVHNRVGGLEVNTLRVGSGLGIRKSLYTAGDLVARFANDVVLTFNGPAGFSNIVGSEVLVDLFQPILQRDVRFEPLVRAERDVIYTARDFVQFRKRMFRDLARQYYDLLRTYREIAINTQDYFSNLDGFNRAAATFQAGRIPSFQVDQFEQNVLTSRGRLIDKCNEVEQKLDQLKIQTGLPPEMPLNLALDELESLTDWDESAAIREQIRRKRKLVVEQIAQRESVAAIPVTAELARRMLSLTQLQQTNSQSADTTVADLEILVAQLEAEDKRMEAAENAKFLEHDNGGEGPLPAQVYLRNEAVLETTLQAIQRELKLLQLLRSRDIRLRDTTDESELPPPADLPEIRTLTDVTPQDDFVRQWELLVIDFRRLSQQTRETPNEEKPRRLPEFILQTKMLLAEADELEDSIITQLSGYGVDLASSQGELLALAQSVVALSNEGDYVAGSGLSPIVVDVDEAMLTALVQRLDLMNVRGELADAWRQIKYAGDDLRSILNVRASQSIRTRLGSTNPFDFSFDDSTTRMSLEFDAPLNRRAERNNFRLALINYNVALRNVIAAEDNVKLDIRNDLRALQLDQNQYEIAIASAALAYERVNSTRLQLAAGQGNITARDFLEAQQAYTTSLNGVARRHIDYILDRIKFFLDLEQLQVDPFNFWPRTAQ